MHQPGDSWPKPRAFAPDGQRPRQERAHPSEAGDRFAQRDDLVSQRASQHHQPGPTGDEQQARDDPAPPCLPLPVQPEPDRQADQDGGRGEEREHQQGQAQPTLALQIVREIHQ